jgi:hypothetical protein
MSPKPQTRRPRRGRNNRRTLLINGWKLGCRPGSIAATCARAFEKNPLADSIISLPTHMKCAYTTFELRQMNHRWAVHFFFLAGFITALAGCSTANTVPSSSLEEMVEALNGQAVVVRQQSINPRVQAPSVQASSAQTKPEESSDPTYNNPNVEHAVDCGIDCPL